MNLDQNTLLFATCFAALAAGVTFAVSARFSGHHSFQQTAARAMITIALSIIWFGLFNSTFNGWFGFIAGGTLMTGFVLARASAIQFRTGQFSWRQVNLQSIGLSGVTGVPYALGYDGLAFLLLNIVCAVLLAETTLQYWRGRAENPVQVGLLASLYGLVGVTYVGCAAAIALESPLVLSRPPDSIAETLNMIVGIASVTGILALTIAISHQRQIRTHKLASETDQLTGISNRRALYDRHADHPLPTHCSLAVFDLDHFKQVNDTFGHQVGDQVIAHFAKVASQHLRRGDQLYRLGGEEFVLIMPAASPSLALAIAEQIRSDFGRQLVDGVDRAARTTVSVGVWSTCEDEGQSLDTGLRAADKALYRAKSQGRNQSVNLRLVA